MVLSSKYVTRTKKSLKINAYKVFDKLEKLDGVGVNSFSIDY